MPQCTDFSSKRGSPFQKGLHEEKIKAANTAEVEFDKNKVIQADLINRLNKKSAEIASSKPTASDGFFTEVVTAGAFTASKPKELTQRQAGKSSIPQSAIPKSLFGYPSSANSLALEAKADLESDTGMSQDIKEKVVTKLFLLANMVQHVYESKVRVAADLDKLKDKYAKDENRREIEHSEQLYKLSMNFQDEVVQMIQQLKTDIDASKGNIRCEIFTEEPTTTLEVTEEDACNEVNESEGSHNIRDLSESIIAETSVNGEVNVLQEENSACDCGIVV